MDTLDLAILIAVIFFLIQLKSAVNTRAKLESLKDFFGEKGQKYTVANDGFAQINLSKSEPLNNLIGEINTYVIRNHGTTDFSIIQNKTERHIETLFEDATSRTSFPIYMGLMGTFVGVFIGLFCFNLGLEGSAEGVNDTAITGLIYGVMVSMFTSFAGLFMTTALNNFASNVRKRIDDQKNAFYDFVQTELMPSLGVSMVAALNKLHNTIGLFEPAFNGVIDRFQNTFDNCTARFGTNFEKNVTLVSKAVAAMGQNMCQINENVRLNQELIKTMGASKMRTTLNSFINAASYFDMVVKALDQFKVLADSLDASTDELIKAQQRYNQSLQIPQTIVNGLNNIFDRINKFERSINNLGEAIAGTNLVTNATIKEVDEQLKLINAKNDLALGYADVADDKLNEFFRNRVDKLDKANQHMLQSIDHSEEKYNDLLVKIRSDLELRQKELTEAFEASMSPDQLKNELSKLEQLDNLEQLDMLEQLDKLDKLDKLENIEKLLVQLSQNKAKEADKFKDKGRRLDLTQTNELLNQLLEVARQKKRWPF